MSDAGLATPDEKRPAPPGDIPVRDAASVLVLDRGADGPRVLMGQRGKAAAFMPSKFVFPGGALDAGDSQAGLAGALLPQTARRLALEPRDGSPATPQGLAAAALRELAEETGLLCGCAGQATWPEYAQGGLCPDPSGLIYMFRAITPPRLPRRYDTRFFLLDTAMIHGDPRDFSRASDELSNIHWVALAEARKLDLPFITEIILAELDGMLHRAGSAPLSEPEAVPFFDNRGPAPRFMHLA